MQNSYRMFMLAAEEMNFTKAATRAFVSQQCLSDHIKRLEAEMQSKFFKRTPKLKLTPAGELLYQSIQRIDSIEKDLANRLKEVHDGQIGNIRFGINATRAKIFLPSLLNEFHKLYPKVTISVVLDDTVNLSKMLLENKIDFFLGVDCQPNELFEFIPINGESMYLIATNKFLKTWYKGAKKWTDLKSGSSINIHNFPGLPLAGNRGISTANKLMRQFLLQQNIIPNQIFSISDYDTQISLCGRNIVATFCSMFTLDLVIDYNTFKPYRDTILILKVKSLTEKLRIDIIKPKEMIFPQYMKEFIKLATNQMNNYGEKISNYIDYK